MNPRDSLSEPLSNEEYVTLQGKRCPNCASSALIGEEMELHDSGANQFVRCQECFCSWIDHYTLTGYDSLEASE